MRSRIKLKTGILIIGLAAVMVITTGWIINNGRVSLNRLPAVNEYQVSLPGSGMPLDTPNLVINSNTPIKQHGHIEAVANELSLYGDQGGSYCIYRLGPFAPADKINAVAVTARWVDEQELEYRVGFADFGDDSWKMSKPINQGMSRAVEVPQLTNPFNDQGEMYLAVAVNNPKTAVRINRIDVSLELAKGAPARIETAMLKKEIIGVPVAIPLAVLDSNGRVVPDYSDNLTLIADNGEETLTCNAEFYDGIARPTVTFSEQGTYVVSLTGSGSSLDGPLGALNLYETQLPIYSLAIDTDTIISLDDNLRSNQYQDAALSINGKKWKEAKVRYRGQSRRNADKRSWKVKLCGKADIDDKEWGYDRESFNLITDPADTTMLREKLSYDLMRDMGVPAPRTRFIHLRINDVFQGLYMDVENPRKGWLSAMGLDDDGSMYKAAPGNLSRLSRVSEYEARYEKKTREDESYNDLAELCAYLDDVSHGGEVQAKEALDDTFFMEHLTNYVVALTLVSSRENWMHNYYLYHDMDETGKWLIFPWDLDMTWSYDGPGRLDASDPIDMRARTNVLMSIFFNNPLMMDSFRQSLGEALTDVFTEARMTERIDEYYAVIHEDVMADWQKKGTNEEYEEHVKSLKLYVKDRSEFLAQQIANS